MKRLFLTNSLLLLFAFDASAQGYINFNTRVTGVVVGHVYNYDGVTLLAGSGYYAELWYAVGSGQPESALGPLAGSLTTFRTGATLGGTPDPVVLPVPGVVPGTGIGTFQVRAWDNAGGTITSWALAQIKGRSIFFDVTNLGDGVTTPPGNLEGFQSFFIVPEPSGLALSGLGALGLWFFRRARSKT